MWQSEADIQLATTHRWDNYFIWMCWLLFQDFTKEAEYNHISALGISKVTTVQNIFDCAASCAASYQNDNVPCVAFTYDSGECKEFGNDQSSETITAENNQTDPDLYLYTGEF